MTAGTNGIAVTSDGAITMAAANADKCFILTADGTRDLFTVGLGGSHDTSLILTSAGTGSDAARVSATGPDGSECDRI